MASGTATLNQFMERDADALMRRTVSRPLPAGRMTASNALGFGLLLSVGGGLYLLVAVNALASFLALATLASYLLLYTPLKRKTPWCTFIGAFPGAMPPLIGWAGVNGSLSKEAWVLYAILFLWQFPHFLASLGCIATTTRALVCRCCLAATTTERRRSGRSSFVRCCSCRSACSPHGWARRGLSIWWAHSCSA